MNLFIKSLRQDLNFFNSNIKLNKTKLLFYKYRNLLFGNRHSIIAGRKFYSLNNRDAANFVKIISEFYPLLIKIKKPKIIFDIGANMGLFSIFIKNMFPETDVYAFEPIPRIYKLLVRNLGKYNNVNIENFGLSDKEGKFMMKFDKKDSSKSRFDKDGDIKIRTTALDKYAKETKKIDLIKIDVETFEKHVLLGAKNTLKKIDYILIEITTENNPNYTEGEIRKILSDFEQISQISNKGRKDVLFKRRY